MKHIKTLGYVGIKWAKIIVKFMPAAMQNFVPATFISTIFLSDFQLTNELFFFKKIASLIWYGLWPGAYSRWSVVTLPTHDEKFIVLNKS